MVFNTDEIIYYSVMWSLAFLAGSCRTLRDRQFISGWDCVTVGGVGGFYAFAVVSICSYYGPGVADFGWGYLGVATAIGTLGKEQDKITRAIFTAFIAKLTGVNVPIKNEDTPKQN